MNGEGRVPPSGIVKNPGIPASPFPRVIFTFQSENRLTILYNKHNLFRLVGVAGFEPTTSCSQSRRDTGLRYTPNVARYSMNIEQ
jgi:hypothetical protein